jgi:hypothetical protein
MPVLASVGVVRGLSETCVPEQFWGNNVNI